ncbi:MAG TPA: protein kinase [Promineifilum sp.]|nr:protein kinase [Promineifilum sp.]
MTLSVGQVLENRYRVVSLLGQGGMGAVYRAWDLNLRVPVALKENLDLSLVSQQQFEREALLLAQLNHPNLPRVTNHFVIPGQGQYLVMEFIEGQDLQQWLDQRGKLTEAEAVPIVGQIASALAYLHSRPEPVIHRDVKPANIKITPDNRAILVDFGIAKQYTPQGHTTRGAQAITPGFSPPEQYGLGTTDARSDIYAVGATLYALLTGETPVESVSRLAGATLPRPGHLTPSVARAILQAMEMEPQNRFQNAMAFAMALSSQVVDDKPPVDQRRLWPVAAVAIFVLLTVAGFFVLRPLLSGRGGTATPDGSSGQEAKLDESSLATQTAIAVAQESLAASQSTATAAALTAVVEGDQDADGLSNDQEAALSTDPGDSDSDDDGLSDGDEVLIVRSDPNNRDSDGDLLLDGDEVNVYATNPSQSDSDGDGDSDGLEVAQGSDPLSAAAPNLTTPEPPSPTQTVKAKDAADLVEETIGFSAGGQPITLYKLGDGARVVTLVGGIHAGFAPGGVAIVEQAMGHFVANPDEIPAGMALHFIPNSNPDSRLAVGELPGRVNANGVDVNRNFGCDWSATAMWRNAPIDAGDGPFSEPESAALRDYFLDARPAVVIFYDARAAQGWVSPGECDGSMDDTVRFAEAYASASGYIYTVTDPIVGDASNWLVSQGTPAFFVLLRDYEEVTANTLERNLDGIRDTIAVAAP